MPVYQNGKTAEGSPQQASQPPAQSTEEMQALMAQLATLTKGLAAAQGIQLQGGAEVDPAEALQKLAEAASRINDGGVVDGGIGDTDVVKGNEKSRNTLDLLKEL